MPFSYEVFMQEKALKGVSKKTLAWYEVYLKPWFKLTEPSDFRQRLRSYVNRYKKGSTQQAGFRAVKSFELWKELESGELSPIRRCKGWKFAPVPQPAILTEDEFQTLLQQIPENTWPKWRDKMALKMLYWTGARAGAVLGMKVFDLDKMNQTATVTTKGQITAQIGVPKRIVNELETYIEENRLAWDAYLFDAGKGPVTIRNLARRLEWAKKRTTITHRVWLHGLRHAAATRMLERCGDVAAVQRQLLHKDITTTMRYAQVSISQAKKAVEA